MRLLLIEDDHRLHHALRRSLRLVDDLLTLARADGGGAMPPHTEEDLADLVLDVAEHLAPLARARGMTLAIEPLPELLVRGDRAALTRLLTNVVENGLKYGAGHGTRVRISGGQRRRDGVAGVWLRVADDGPGIAAEHLPHLGERFYREDAARSRRAAPEGGAPDGRPGGTGLGLAIGRAIVQRHGGHLRIASELGHGTTVDMWFPAAGEHPRSSS